MPGSNYIPFLLSLAACHSIAAFAPSPSTSASSISRSDPRSLTNGVHLFAGEKDEASASPDVNRRNALRTLLSRAFLPAAVACAVPPSARAESDLFKPNPLTNPVLETIRIWNQDEADNIRYGGELESGSAKPRAFDQYVALLQPILTVERDLSEVDKLLGDGKPATKEDCISVIENVSAILSRSLFDKVNFKKAFNAFADNIYYSDPDRANLYLGGGAIPKNEQSIAYLVRNDVLTNVEDMRAETAYLLRELAKLKDGETVRVGGEEGLDFEEINSLSKSANGDMIKYLDLVPPKELEAARAKFAAK